MGQVSAAGRNVYARLHMPLGTRLLWVYEGLTEYLGEVLMVRSGYWKRKNIGNRSQPPSGRSFIKKAAWRPLEDTAAASYLLRGHRQSWNY